MAQFAVEVDFETFALLTVLAEADGVSATEELARCVRARRKERFFESLETGLRGMSVAEHARDAGERILWDRTLADGSEDWK